MEGGASGQSRGIDTMTLHFRGLILCHVAVGDEHDADGKCGSFHKNAAVRFGLPRCVVFISGKNAVRKSWVLCVLRKILEKSNKFQKMFPLSTFYG